MSHSGEEIVSEIKEINIKNVEPTVRLHNASNSIEINMPSNRKSNYVAEVFNNIGQRVASKAISENHSQIDVNSFDNGVYHVVIRNSDFNEAYSYKIVK